MAMLVLEEWLEEEIRADRAARDIDHHDECWDGVYIVSPNPNNEHQLIVLDLAYAFKSSVGEPELGRVFPGINLSDRESDWTHNYRVPDIAIYLAGNPARNLDTHWLGGPDLAVEILSPGDRARDKLPFYASVGTRELLIVDRDPWQLEMYRLDAEQLILVGRSAPDGPEPLASAVLPLTFRLAADKPRPRIEVVHQDGRRWLA